MDLILKLLAYNPEDRYDVSSSSYVSSSSFKLLVYNPEDRYLP
jgi:hypothetical protein